MAIIPNIIHSLDASHLSEIIINAFENKTFPILTVHDCFGTHPNYIYILQFRLKEEFINLYLDNKFLKTFQKRIMQYIKDNNFLIVKENKNYYVLIDKNIKSDNNEQYEKLLIPKPPIKNSLDIANIIKSKYMFN